MIERYQTTTHVPEALHRLVESYLALGVKSEAQEAAAVLGYNFPGSDWYQDSYYLMTGEGSPAPVDESAAGSSACSDRACMLVSLSIRDFVLIEKLDLNFSRIRQHRGRLGALTGETGAGKSILIDALGLALGARAESGAVRRGANQASVAASFDLPRNHPARGRAGRAGARRRGRADPAPQVGADGRGRAFVNDQPVSVALLRRLGDTLVEIQGQMEQHGLLDMATHRASLDAFAGLEKQGDAVRAAWRAWRDRRAGARRRRSGRRRRAARRGFPAPCREGARGAGAQAG